jgi:hypothetical protein
VPPCATVTGADVPSDMVTPLGNVTPVVPLRIIVISVP